MAPTATLGTVQIAILLFDRFAAFDAVAAHDALSALPDADVTFVAPRPGPWRDETGQLELTADAALREIPRPHVAVLPGGEGVRPLCHDRAVRAWLAGASADPGWILTVGAGALLAACAGVLVHVSVAAPASLRDELLDAGALTAVAPVAIDRRVASAAHAQSVPALVARLAHPALTLSTSPKGPNR